MTKAIVVLVWGLVLIGSVMGGLDLPAFSIGPKSAFGYTILAMMLMPIAVFAVLGKVLAGYPFDVPHIRNAVDRRFGPDAYRGFLSQLKLLLLFSIASLVSSVVTFLVARKDGSSDLGQLLAAFYFSGAVGFLILRTMLKRRGLSPE
jgi:hypothetical protein